MELHLKGGAKAGKELKVKREKQDKIEVLHCHLIVDELHVMRPAIDLLCGQKRGWASSALFDDLGAPRMRMVLRLKDLQLDAHGKIYREGKIEAGNLLNLKETRATKIDLELIPTGALMKVRFTWNTVGDEAEDCAGLLGRDVEIDVVLKAAAQMDLAQPDSPAVKGAGRRARRESPPRVPMTIVDRETGEVLSGEPA